MADNDASEEAWGDEPRIHGALFTESLGDVPRREALVVPSTASVAETIQAMNDRHVGCALVVDGGKLCGIFTERDVLRRVAGTSLDLAATPVARVMTPNPDSLPAGASIAFGLRKMSVEGFRHIPLVAADGSPVGVIGVRDIISWMVSFFPDSVTNLPPEPQFPGTLDGG